MYALVREVYRRTARELQRLEANARSPLYAHLLEAYDGADVLRTAPAVVTRYHATYANLVDTNSSAYWMLQSVSRWCDPSAACATPRESPPLTPSPRPSLAPGGKRCRLGLRLDFVGALIVFGVALVAAAGKTTIDPCAWLAPPLPGTRARTRALALTAWALPARPRRASALQRWPACP